MSDETEGVESPPYPPHTVTSPNLYNYLARLHEWLALQQGVLLAERVPAKLKSSLRDPPPNLASRSVWENVAIADKYAVLMYMRQIREGWDYVLREHEDSWDSLVALRKRYHLVMSGRQCLSEAFLNPEVRELRNQQQYDQYQARMKLINQHMKQVLIPPELREEAEQEQKQADDDESAWMENDDQEEPT